MLRLDVAYMCAASDSIRILYIDNEPDSTGSDTTFLKRGDNRFTTETAASACGGLELLSEREFDCIISDYDPPQIDGIEFLETVREDYPFLPFIFFTGNGSEKVASEAISAGVTDYLRKRSGTDQCTVLRNHILNAVESHRSQQARTERNHKLRKYERMVNTMQEAACIYDANGHFEIVNEYLADWYGTTREEIEGRQSNLISHIRQQAEPDQYEELLAGNREEIHGELADEFPEHGHAILEYRLTPLIVNGSIKGAVGVARDITEHRERERELTQYKKIVETIDDGVYVVDEEDRFVMANDAYAEMFGYDRAELLGAPVSRIVDQSVAEQAQQLEAAMRRGTVDTPTIEAELPPSEGTRHYLEAKFALLPAPGNHEYRVGVVRDISERKEGEQELQRQNERLNEFASVVSHDLRNPLQLADGRLELARAECDSEHLEHVSRALGRMSTLIEELLTLARGGETVTDLERVDLAAIAEESWATVETAGATLAITTDQTIEADESRLKQVFENLVGNAIEHGDEDVTVTVGSLDNGFYIEDDGPGITEDTRDNVFDAGFSTTEAGTGFGLRIVHQVVENHGWEVAVTDSSEGGARFEITGVEFITE